MSQSGKGHPCAYCRRRMEARGNHSRLAATKDHVVPKSMNGTHTVWCCRQCNNLKANLTPAQWSAFMALFPKWWQTFRTGGIPMHVRARLLVQHLTEPQGRGLEFPPPSSS